MSEQWCYECDGECGELANFKFCGKCGHPRGKHFPERKKVEPTPPPKPPPSPSHARTDSRPTLARGESVRGPPPRPPNSLHTRNESARDLKREGSVKTVSPKLQSKDEVTAAKIEKLSKVQPPKAFPLSKYFSESRTNIGKWLETLPWERKQAEQALEQEEGESSECRPRSKGDAGVNASATNSNANASTTSANATRTKSPPPRSPNPKGKDICQQCGAENALKFCPLCGKSQKDDGKAEAGDTPSESMFKSLTKKLRGGPQPDSAQQALVARREQITLIAGQQAASQLPGMIQKIAQEDTKAAVEALLGLSKPLEAAFNPERVSVYRATAPKHQAKYPEAPEYSSDAALQVITEFKVTVIVDAASTEYKVSHKDTAENLLAKVPGKGLILKAKGLNSYFDGPNLLLSYEFVRERLRKSRPLVFLAVSRPEKVVGKAAWTGWGGTSPAPGVPKTFTPFSKIKGEFSMKNIYAEGLPMGDGQLIVSIMLVYANDMYPNSFVMSTPTQRSPNPSWLSQQLTPQHFDLTKIPREARAIFSVLVANKDQRELLGAVALNMFDEHGKLLQGPRHLKLQTGLGTQPMYSWERDANLIQVYCRMATGEAVSENAPLLHLDLTYYGGPVIFDVPEQKNPDIAKKHKEHFQDDTAQLMQRLDADPLFPIPSDSKRLLWGVRASLVDKPRMLPFVAQSCDWSEPEQRREMQTLAVKWARPEVETLLQLLDVKVSDTILRDVAVQGLAKLPPHTLQPYILQLIQCLKFESYHRSSLSNFLVKTALAFPLVFGHPLYWAMRSEMQMHPTFAERFSLILAEILSSGGPLVQELRIQTAVMDQLQRVAELIVSRKEAGKMTKDEMNAEYVNELVKLNCFFFARCTSWKLPLNPQVEVGNLIVEKCRFMSSKKVPLWLVFENADRSAPPVYVMFKSGDDLRQDMLTLQLLRIMDDVWLQQGLDLGLTPYRVIATGVNELQEGLGMIEVVLNADTTAGIQHEFGGGAMGAFKQTPLYDYLAKHNPGEAELAAARERFMRSSAGYCVATYIMGIGDRHNGNIMVTKDGHLFHIDFGHFLGNFKSKFGYKRERTPFVFTPEMAYVIGGKNFQQDETYKGFQSLCVQAFNALRTRGALLETLFACMVSAGMPELLCEEDVMYMRGQLLLTMSNDDAGVEFLKQVNASVTATSRRLDNFIHIAKHA